MSAWPGAVWAALHGVPSTRCISQDRLSGVMRSWTMCASHSYCTSLALQTEDGLRLWPSASHQHQANRNGRKQWGPWPLLPSAPLQAPMYLCDQPSPAQGLTTQHYPHYYLHGTALPTVPPNRAPTAPAWIVWCLAPSTHVSGCQDLSPPLPLERLISLQHSSRQPGTVKSRWHHSIALHPFQASVSLLQDDNHTLFSQG